MKEGGRGRERERCQRLLMKDGGRKYQAQLTGRKNTVLKKRSCSKEEVSEETVTNEMLETE